MILFVSSSKEYQERGMVNQTIPQIIVETCLILCRCEPAVCFLMPVAGTFIITALNYLSMPSCQAEQESPFEVTFLSVGGFSKEKEKGF